MIPDELIVTDTVEYTVNGITVCKDISEFLHILYRSDISASYSVMNGTAQVKMNIFDAYSIEYIMATHDLDLPDEATATESD